MLDIRNFTRSKPPRLSYEEIAKAVLPGWDISLVFVGETRAKKLNEQLRSKDYTPNVLSYESGDKSGEIIICTQIAKKECKSYGLTSTQHIGYLFIHGLLHLKGYPHGPTMDKLERAHTAQFIGVSVPNGTKNNDRH
ncbi:MAG TPA: rRNA maturation RNase YbeY [Candidatus Paceibacterota bacterium]|nr:rRNA maturation RNase YbeY [Candidatus Paceibacterota bacterium]